MGGRANVARSRASCCVNLRCVTLFPLRIRFAGQTQPKCKFKQRRLQQCRSLAQHRSAGFLSFVNPGTEFGPIWKPDVGSIFQPDSGAIYCPPPTHSGSKSGWILGPFSGGEIGTFSCFSPPLFMQFPAGFHRRFPATKLKRFSVPPN